MSLTESVRPSMLTVSGASFDAFSDRRSHAQKPISSRKYPSRRPHAFSMSSTSSISSTSSTTSMNALRLADVAKQYGFGVHVENWREDMQPIRQYLPMQHIIGSLKRDRDDQVQFTPVSLREATSISRRHSEMAAFSPKSDDSFMELLRSPKRRRMSTFSGTESECSSSYDPDRRFSYQATEHVPKDIPQAALPGLNHVLNLTSITADERDIFTEYAPKHLEDTHLLMNEVLQLREQMMDEEYAETPEEDEEYQPMTPRCHSPIVPPEREAEVKKAFEDFIDLDDSRRFIAKI